MKRFKDLQISRKLTIGFFVLSIIAVIIGVGGIFGMYQINTADTELYEKQTKPLADISDIMNDVYAMRVEVRGAVVYYNDADKLKAAEEQYRILDKTLAQSIELYAPTISTAASKALFEEAGLIYTNEYKPTAENVFKIAKLGNFDNAQEALSGLTDTTNKIIANYQQCFDNRVSNAKQTSEGNDRLFMILTCILAAIIIIGITIAIFLGKYISRIISRPITKMVDAAEQIAIGNTNVNIDVESEDETGMLAQSFNKMINGIKEQANIVSDVANGDLTVEVTPRSDQDTMGIALKKTIKQLNVMFNDINQASEQVSIGSEQVSNASQALSQGATEQASSIEELSASIMQVSSQVNENAENVLLATTYVEQAAAGVNQSNGQMKNMLIAMTDIDNSSNEISKIIKVIDDIAFQTNILALNAAVEAARAGSAGKGFAVVADEVRNLASKSADAAKQTTSLIENSIKIVGNGSKIAEQTAVSLADVETKTKLVTETMGKIAKASNEQATAITQINLGVEQISMVIQTNSATAEESAASSEELSGQAGVLKQQIATFKLKQHQKSDRHPSKDQINLDDAAYDNKPNNYSSYDLEFGKY